MYLHIFKLFRQHCCTVAPRLAAPRPTRRARSLYGTRLATRRRFCGSGVQVHYRPPHRAAFLPTAVKHGMLSTKVSCKVLVENMCYLFLILLHHSFSLKNTAVFPSSGWEYTLSSVDGAVLSISSLNGSFGPPGAPQSIVHGTVENPPSGDERVVFATFPDPAIGGVFVTRGVLVGSGRSCDTIQWDKPLAAEYAPPLWIRGPLPPPPAPTCTTSYVHLCAFFAFFITKCLHILLLLRLTDTRVLSAAQWLTPVEACVSGVHRTTAFTHSAFMPTSCLHNRSGTASAADE